MNSIYGKYQRFMLFLSAMVFGLMLGKSELSKAWFTQTDGGWFELVMCVLVVLLALVDMLPKTEVRDSG